MKRSCSSSLSPQLPICNYWQKKPMTMRSFKKLSNTRGEEAVCVFLAAYSGWRQERKVLHFQSTMISAKVSSAWGRKADRYQAFTHPPPDPASTHPPPTSRLQKLLLPVLRDTQKWAKSWVGGRRKSQIPECDWEVAATGDCC